MTKNTSITPHENGWAILRNGILTKVYPSRHLALTALKDEMTRHERSSRQSEKALGRAPAISTLNPAHPGNSGAAGL